MLLKIYNENPAPRHIKKMVEILNNGGVVIFPTDTIYGLGCSLIRIKAVDRIASIKGIKRQKANFSVIFNNLSMLAEFTRPIENHIYKLMRKNLPGPFTFILPASNKVPKLFQSKKKTIGIRIPDNNIVRAIVEELGHPLVTTSVHDDDELIEYTTDPELIHEKYRVLVDMVVDGGPGHNEASTVVDCTGGEAVILRQGKGSLQD